MAISLTRSRVWIVLLVFPVWSGCDGQEHLDHKELLGSWEYDMARTVSGFIQSRNTMVAVGIAARVDQFSSAFAGQVRRDGFRTRLVIHPKHIEIDSPLGTEKLGYSVVSKDGATYTLLATGQDQEQREVTVRRHADIDAISFRSRDCRELPAGCLATRTAMARRLGMGMPPEAESSIRPSATTAGVGDCGETPCAKSRTNLNPMLPRWLYYVRAGKGGEQVHRATRITEDHP